MTSKTASPKSSKLSAHLQMPSQPASSAERLLSDLPKGANVAVVSMLGSLCPITLGHVQCYEEARGIIMADPSSQVPRPARLEHFDECLGLISLNGDNHVMSKVAAKGQTALTYQERAELVRLATADHPWLNFEDRDNCIRSYRARFPDLNFVDFDMNGADDVVKYEKWGFCTYGDYRMFVMGRPGFTSTVVHAMKKHGIDPDAGQLIVGPELPDISSTEARNASNRGDVGTLLSLLHPSVADFLLRKDGHKGLERVDVRDRSEICVA